LSYRPAEVRVLDNNETDLFLLQEELRHRPEVHVFLGDVRDRFKLENVLGGVELIFHTAAYKHVVLAEYNPFEVVQTNILATQNVIQQALRAGVEKLIFTSSDKAANPTNVMGTSKLMCERLITAANLLSRNPHQIFTSTRFGNVVGSRGSVVPLFASQIAQGGPVTLTDRRMTRFVMTPRQSAELILSSAMLAKGGEVFIAKMPALRISDLARVMIEELAPAWGHRPEDIEVQEIGAKPGEKFYEELLTEEEASHSLELPDHFVILPAFRSMYLQREYSYPGAKPARVSPYTSQAAPLLEPEEIRSYLRRHRVLEPFLP
jgi:FlaA1/EpsC-like NDP-sugar epimerase